MHAAHGRNPLPCLHQAGLYSLHVTGALFATQPPTFPTLFSISAPFCSLPGIAQPPIAAPSLPLPCCDCFYTVSCLALSGQVLPIP